MNRERAVCDMETSLCRKQLETKSFSSPEAALLLVSTKNRDLWPSPTPEVHDSRTSRHSAHVQSQVRTNLIGSGLDLLCLQSHSKTECRRRKPEVAILGADQKEHGLWGRELNCKQQRLRDSKLAQCICCKRFYLFLCERSAHET